MIIIYLVLIVVILQLCAVIEYRILKNKKLKQLHLAINPEHFLAQIVLVLKYQDRPLNEIKTLVDLEPLMIGKILAIRKLADSHLIYQELTKTDYSEYKASLQELQRKTNQKYQRLTMVVLIIVMIWSILK